jgi:hypothetical protein
MERCVKVLVFQRHLIRYLNVLKHISGEKSASEESCQHTNDFCKDPENDFHGRTFCNRVHLDLFGVCLEKIVRAL